MENASKALVIAGAILISILLISIGLVVFNSAKGVVDQGSQASRLMEAEVYNSNFTKYCGDKVLGRNVKELQNFVNSYKSANPETNIQVVVSTSITSINVRSYYKVYVPDGGYADGYITKINVDPIS